MGVWEVYELPTLAVTETAKGRWADSLQAERDRIILQLAKALGYTGTDVAGAIAYLQSVDPAQFNQVIAGPAYEGWTSFFGIAPGNNPQGRAALKMQVKLAAAAGKWGGNTAAALDPATGYFNDRVLAAKDRFAANAAISIRFIGDPPEQPLGAAPVLAYKVTGIEPPANLVPAEFMVDPAENVIAPALGRYVRGAMVSMIVEAGVIARYAKDAGLDAMATSVLNELAVNLTTLLNGLANPGAYSSITASAGFKTVTGLGEVIYVRVEATPATGP